jgi:hypothetical protein
MFKKNITCLSLLLLLSFNGIAQKITIDVDKQEYNITDKIKITYKVDKDTDSIGEIDESQFEFVAGPSQQVSQEYVNGKTSFSKSYSYFITPLKPGKIKLPQLLMYLDGRTLKAEDVYIDVKGTLLTDEQISNKISLYKEFKAGHLFEISLPSYMERTVGQIDASAVEYRNLANDLYGYVTFDTKENLELSKQKYTSILVYQESLLKNFIKDKEKRMVSKPLSQKRGNINFIETEVTFHDKETNDDFYYLIGAVETKTTFYRIISWSLAKNKNKFKADFQKILYSIND